MRQFLTIGLFVIIVIFGLFVGAFVFQRPHPQDSTSPIETPTPIPAPLTNENLRVSTPAQNQQISSPVLIQGEARVFENVLGVRVTDKNGAILVEDFVMSQAQEAGEFGPFETHLAYPQSSTREGFVEVFHNSPRDGSEIDTIRIPVLFTEVTPTQAL